MSESDWVVAIDPPQLEVSIYEQQQREGDDHVLGILSPREGFGPSRASDCSSSKKRKGGKRKSDASKDALRRVKNEKERQRVRYLSVLFRRLRQVIDDPSPDKKLKKVSVLEATIEYICKQKKVIEELKTGQAEPVASSPKEDKVICNETLECSELVLSPIRDTNSSSSSSSCLSLSLDSPSHTVFINHQSTPVVPSSANYSHPSFYVQMSIDTSDHIDEPSKFTGYHSHRGHPLPPPLHHPVNFYN